MNVVFTLALACAFGCLLILVAHLWLCGWIDHFSRALLSLGLAALAAPFVVTDGFERVWLVVPFAFAMVMVPGLLVSILVEGAWHALTSVKRRRPAARRTQGHGRALRQTWSA
jgi:hypothetical protein